MLTLSELRLAMGMLNRWKRFPSSYCPPSIKSILRRIVEQMEKENCSENTDVMKWCERYTPVVER